MIKHIKIFLLGLILTVLFLGLVTLIVFNKIVGAIFLLGIFLVLVYMVGKLISLIWEQE